MPSRRKTSGRKRAGARRARPAAGAAKPLRRRSLHTVRFPGETARYRNSRDGLLKAERELRRHVEQVAALRRRMPMGASVAKDYAFEEDGADGTVRTVRLSELFVPGKESLLVYSFMYGPNMQRPCPSCTCFIDGLNAMAPHVAQRTNLVVVARSPMPRIREFARDRGWRNLRLLSSSRNSYNPDYHGEDASGGQWPVMNVFVQRNGRVHHFYASELVFAPSDPGQDPRHLDLMWPLWNLFDLIPEGRGKDWYPALNYATP